MQVSSLFDVHVLCRFRLKRENERKNKIRKWWGTEIEEDTD
jgi:hypothetical protein